MSVAAPHRSFRRARRLLVALAAVLGVPSATIRAQSTAAGCPAGATRAVESASGRRISAIHIVTRGPDGLPGGLGTALHVTTRDATVRSRLLFAPGDFVDTLRVAESVRLLRRLRYLAGAAVTATCDSAGGVVLAVVTQDVWSMTPRLSTDAEGGAVAGLEETNLFGTGRTGRVYARSDRGQLGVGVAYSDPAMLGARLLGTISHDAYGDGGAWNATLRTKDAGVFEDWGFAAVARHSTRQSVRLSTSAAPGDTVRRSSLSLLVRRRLSSASTSATFLLAGAEAEGTMLVSGPELPLAGPPSVRRTFVGIDAGLARRAGQFDVIPWLLPSTGDAGAQLAPAELPIGVEGEGIIGLGRDLAAGRPAGRIDLWAGRIWRVGRMDTGGDGSEPPIPRAVLSSDVWVSGYHPLAGGGEWSAGTVRGSLALVTPAQRGLWFAQLSGERLVDPDPDVRRLVMVNRAQHALPPGGRLAELAVSASLERTYQLLGARHGVVLDGAAFAVGSAWRDFAAPRSPAASVAGNPIASGVGLLTADDEPQSATGIERLHVGILGVGLRLTPTRFGRSTFGIDLGFPVVRSSQVSGRPYVAVSIRPAFGLGRGRDGALP